MMNKGYGMGHFRSGNSENGKRKEFQEKWSKMTDEEKLDFANKKFDKRERFSVEKLDEFTENWTKMSAEEKQTYVEERKARFKEWKHHRHAHNSGCRNQKHGERNFGKDGSVIIKVIS